MVQFVSWLNIVIIYNIITFVEQGFVVFIDDVFTFTTENYNLLYFTFNKSECNQMVLEAF